MQDWNDTLDQHLTTIAQLRDAGAALERIAAELVQIIRAGGRVLLAGNGGSAADAQHIAAELVGRFRRARRALPAIALSTDTSALTAISNDFGFEQVFARQVQALLTPADALWVLSTSGNSPNIVAALGVARQRGALTIGFSGQGGAMAPLCTHLFCVPHARSDRIQEAHVLAYHFVCERIEAAFTSD